jgi:hypothetical protein
VEGDIEVEAIFGPVEKPREQGQVGGTAADEDVGQPMERA